MFREPRSGPPSCTFASPEVCVHAPNVPFPSPAIPVVCAIIERNGEVLVAQRPPHKHLPLKWEFPGGKVETGEEPADALVREIREELHCRLDQLVALPSSLHDYGSIRIEMLPFVARLAEGSPHPKPQEHVAIRWVAADRLAQLDLAAADLPVLRTYLAQRARPA